MNIEMLSNFSILKSFNDGGKNILDSLMPFLEFGIAAADSEYIDFADLKKVIHERCYLDIPTNTLKTLLKRLKKKGILTNLEGWEKIQLVNNFNLNTKKYNEQITASIRDINKLSQNCKEYCHFDISLEVVTEKIFEFISLYQQYIDISENDISQGHGNGETEERLPEVIKQEDIIENFFVKEQSAEMSQIASYITYISKCDNESYLIFKNIFFGFLLSQLVATGLNNDNCKIKNITIYADSNFILRVIDMQAPPFVTASKELLNLIKDYGITIVTFPEIVEEIRVVLNKTLVDYIKTKDDLIALHGECVKQLDGVIGSFFRRNMELTEITAYIEGVENHIKDEGIAILSKGLDQELKYFDKEYEKIIKFKLEKNHLKPDDTHMDWKIDLIKKRALTDVKILEYIRKARKQKQYSFESCEHVLLTCDNILYVVNSSYHKPYNSIPEAMSENCLTDTLFLSNPKLNSDASIKLLISMFQTSEYLDYDILSKFHRDLLKYIGNNPKDQKYLGYIFNNQNLFSELKDSYDTEEDNDSSDYIMDLFIKAKQDEDSYNIEITSRIKKLEEEKDVYKKQLDALVITAEQSAAVAEVQSAAVAEVQSAAVAEVQSAAISEPYVEKPVNSIIAPGNENTDVNKIPSKNVAVYMTFKILTGTLLFTFFSIALLLILFNIDIEKGFNTNLLLTLRNLSYFLIPIFIFVFSVNLYLEKRIDKIIDRMFLLSEESVLKVIGQAIVQSLLWILFVIIISIATGIVGNIIYDSMK